MATMWAPRRFAATRCGAVLGWLARLAPQRMMRSELAPMSSLVLTCTGPVSDMPKPPRPQHTMAGSQVWKPHRLAKRGTSRRAPVFTMMPWPIQTATDSGPAARIAPAMRSSA